MNRSSFKNIADRIRRFRATPQNIGVVLTLWLIIVYVLRHLLALPNDAHPMVVAIFVSILSRVTGRGADDAWAAGRPSVAALWVAAYYVPALIVMALLHVLR